MGNLVNTENSDNKDFSPNVDNSIRKSNSSTLGKVVWYSLFLLIIPIIIHVVMRNNLNRSQIKINELASGIDIQLKKRRDTLVKLFDATKSYIKYEKSILTDITKLRKSTFDSSKIDSNSSKLDNLSGKIMAVAERYPDLNSHKNVLETMEQASYLEREIAASRRLYNSEVSSFNSKLFTWPTNVIASGMNLNTFKMFKASDSDKEDVNLSFDV